MSVTQNYKTITTMRAAADAKTFKLSASDDVIQYIVIAVMQKLFADQDRIKVAENPALVSFLGREIALGSDALTALNCRSIRYRELEGEMLGDVTRLLRNEMVKLREEERGLRSSKISCDMLAGKIDRVNAALLFLENPK